MINVLLNLTREFDIVYPHCGLLSGHEHNHAPGEAQVHGQIMQAGTHKI